ncbi:MAG: competence/damage-inducible protein A [Anaerolineales bacterium]|nr:CinA family nicotinamide mononucleotide deamidase-related protein [Anaerolineae bacterium]PWB51173.1 MAG: competence/damage-inducible protein A [Anaerolineales bacterium]
MPSAEIITIGTEILLGDIVDTNARFLAQSLRDAGIDLFRKTTVGDNAQRIAQVIQEALARCEIILTTGGLGPTVDDPTREAVAMAVGVELEFRSELWEQIKARFQRLGRFPTENNRRQAYIPKGSIAFENPVGTAPIFVFVKQSQVIITLPGVPSEMMTLVERTVIPYLRQHYGLSQMIKTRVIHTVGIGESQIDDLIGDYERMQNPTVGLAAHSGQVDVRITVKADSEEAANLLIIPVEAGLRERLGECVYGIDMDTLEEVTMQSVSKNNWTLTVLEYGLEGNIIRRLASTHGPFSGGQVITELPSMERLHDLADACRVSHQADVGLGVALIPQENYQEILLVLITPLETKRYSRRYAGPPEYAPIWAYHQSLDMIRRIPHDN